LNRLPIRNSLILWNVPAKLESFKVHNFAKALEGIQGTFGWHAVASTYSATSAGDVTFVHYGFPNKHRFASDHDGDILITRAERVMIFANDGARRMTHFCSPVNNLIIAKRICILLVLVVRVSNPLSSNERSFINAGCSSIF